MAWVVWSVLGGILVLLAVVSWWHDRDARRRGARSSDPGRGVRDARRDLRADPDLNRGGR
ncbi:hypothetical protein [Modestobacter sp. Leaf380]|uniref:hypothetical protein n=1 Tax=Modestobacter sp. Leaf380 TaxID=1736356 RepID=UPI0012FCA85B|nr:hypothetical protein [Modestobacter sp. Leaf380]